MEHLDDLPSPVGVVVEEADVLRRQLPYAAEALATEVPCYKPVRLLRLEPLVLENLDALEYERSADNIKCDQ